MKATIITFKDLQDEAQEAVNAQDYTALLRKIARFLQRNLPTQARERAESLYNQVERSYFRALNHHREAYADYNKWLDYYRAFMNDAVNYACTGNMDYDAIIAIETWLHKQVIKKLQEARLADAFITKKLCE